MNFVFDLYGTLIDIWTDEECPEFWREVARLLGEDDSLSEKVREEYRALCAYYHKGGYHELDLLRVFEDMLEKRGIDRSKASSFAADFRRLSMVRFKRFHGAKAMLKALKSAGGRIYLLSNAQSCFTIDELRRAKLYSLFDGIVISSDIGVKKPSPEAFKIAFSKLKINPADSIYVGNDMRDDILGATGVGMGTLYINTSQSGKYPDLELPKPTYTVKNHREMKRVLLSLLPLDKGIAK